MKSGITEVSTDRFKTVGAINSPCVPTRGIFSKGRSTVKDKLLLCPASLYLLRKFYIFSFRFGKFLLGGSMGFLKYVNLLSNESDAFAQHLVALNRRESANSALEGIDK